jgi:uncharacterized NAD(P)/FAD-binding protein YdhS
MTLINKNLAIVGGGPAALYLLKAVVEKNVKNINISIFEASNTFGTGMPYSNYWNCLEHELNIASKELPELKIEPHIWLRNQDVAIKKSYGIKDSEINEDIVLPRILFGKYLEEQFNYYLSRLMDSGIKVKLYPNERIEKISKRYNFTLKSARNSYFFDTVVIATGHVWPEKNLDKDYYYVSPYPLSKLHSIKDKNIGIIGSSLTAIDAIRSLARANGEFIEQNNGVIYRTTNSSSNFRITMHSRKGLLPNIRYHLEHPRIRKYEYISELEIRENIASNNGLLSLDYIFNKSYLDTIKVKDYNTYKEIKDLGIEGFYKYYFEREGIKNFNQYELKLSEMKRTEKDRSPIYWKEALEDTIYTLNFHAKNLSAEDTIGLRKYIMPVYNHLVMFVPYRSVDELIALHKANVLDNIELGFDSEIRDGQIHTQNKILQYDLLINCIGQKNLNIEDFPFKDLVRENYVTQASIKITNSISEALTQGCSIYENQLYLPGVAIDDSFQSLSDKMEPTGLYILSIPLIRGFNPDLSGLPLLNDAAELVIDNIQ